MSVYTVVSPEVCAAWLKRYDLGVLIDLEPIEAGIENTNYFLTTSEKSFVLTLYERVSPSRLTFCLAMMQRLAAQGVACPAPQPDREGQLFSLLEDKPAGIVTRLKGAGYKSSGLTESCVRAAAALLATMHQATAEWGVVFENPRGALWRDQTTEAVRPFLSSSQHTLLDAILEKQRYDEAKRMAILPQGAVHLDYFHDNVLFNQDRLEGVIDFGFAATEAYAYDLAIAVNDWCWSRSTQEMNPVFEQAFLESYASLRPLSKEEKEAWPWLLQRAALRFWLSRLYDLHLPRPGALVHAHDPAHFEWILRYHF
jgi:homoserine kinase type II